MNEPLPVVTLDMMYQVEHCCPAGITHMDQMRWKAEHLTEMLAEEERRAMAEEERRAEFDAEMRRDAFGD